MKYVKYPQKDKIRNQAVSGLEMVLRNPNPGASSIPQVTRIKQEIQALEDSTLNPANRDKLKEATDVLERAIKMARGEVSTIGHGPSPRQVLFERCTRPSGRSLLGLPLPL